MTIGSKTILYRPVGPDELDLIEKSGFTAFPPRLPEQPIFYPVLTQDYAIKITANWNVKDHGVGYVTKFEVNSDYLSQYEVHLAGGRECPEYWIPAEDLENFNKNIVGPIEVIRKYGGISE